MTIVDAHVHMGIPTRPAFGNAIAYTAEQVIERMNEAGIDKSLIMPIPHVYDNDYVIESARRYPDRFIPWAYVDPWHVDDAKGFVRSLAEQGFRGMKLRAVSLRYSLSDHYLLDPLLSGCVDAGLAISMHTGDDPACTPLQVEEMARSFPDLTIFLVHAGFRLLAEEAIAVASRCPNVYLDETAGTSWQLRRALEVLGPQKVIYGSDSPFMDTRVELVRFRTAIEDSDDLALALGGNVLRALNLQ